MLAAITMWVLLIPGLPVFDEPIKYKQALHKSLKTYPNARCVQMKVYGYV